MRSYRLYENIDPSAEISAEGLYQANHFDYDMEIGQVFREICEDIVKRGLGFCESMEFIHDIDETLYVKKHFEIMVIAKLLIRNAIDSRASRITVHTFMEGESMVMSIEDNGSGFKNEDIKKAFNPHYHISGEQSGDKGYGLFNVRKAVISTKGKFGFKSIPGEKTVYTVTFPLGTILSGKRADKE